MVLQRNRYYPYGERMASWTPSLTNNDYLYGGKELHTLFSLPFYDSGARYQTTDGIFTSMDPLCEKYYSVSPYAYCSGDPVNYVDPEGRKPRIYIQKHVNIYGHVFVTTGENENTILYTYGRYGNTYGSTIGNQHLRGDGVLKVMKGKYAQDYLKDVLLKGDVAIFIIAKASDQAVNQYYEDCLSKGREVGPEVKKDYSRAGIIDTYDFLINNCTTTSIEAINVDHDNIQTATSIPILLFWGLMSEGIDPDIIIMQDPVDYIQELINQLKESENDQE